MAPDHGEDDFWLCKAHGIDPVFVVQPDGSYRADWPVVGGNHVYKVNAKDGPVCSALSEAGALLSAADFHHSYPHSWRSKAKLIFRCTPQWFVAMDGALPSPSRGEGVSLRQTALGAIEATRFVPPSGQNRIRAMVEGRPDWVLSRQRAWGVPITLFVHRQSGDYLRDPAVNARIRAAIAEKGVDAWYDTPAEDFIGNAANAADYEKVTDILDVWFDSGSTHAFVLESGVWPELASPADLYLEGSDQHRGWFQSSLLESCGTRGRAPYKAVLTHGFTLDGQGRKMSKSLGNTIDPLTVIKENGADILRLWVVSTNFVEDQRIGKEILAGTVDAYRKLRNTLRYLLGALEGFSEAERLDLDDSAVVACLPELERWMLGRIHSLDALVRQATNDFDFNRLYTALFQFCTVDLSALYVDIRKDSLYCDGVMSNRRRACRSVLDRLFHHLTLWLAPILAFTAEEAWQTRFPGPSVHLGVWPAVPACWADEALAARWARVLELRLVVTGALEVERREKRIGSSLQAAPVLHASAEDAALLAGLDMAEVCITSALTISTEPAPDSAFRLADVPGVAVVPLLATAEKCARCWQHLPEVGSHAEHPELCNRCHDVVTAA
jgi:isoleucyl-tRNA synthetase